MGFKSVGHVQKSSPFFLVMLLSVVGCSDMGKEEKLSQRHLTEQDQEEGDADAKKLKKNDGTSDSDDGEASDGKGCHITAEQAANAANNRVPPAANYVFNRPVSSTTMRVDWIKGSYHSPSENVKTACFNVLRSTGPESEYQIVGHVQAIEEKSDYVYYDYHLQPNTRYSYKVVAVSVDGVLAAKGRRDSNYANTPP